MAPLCKFWQQGNCRYGTSCRFEHPGANANPFGAPSGNANRFGPLASGGGSRGQDPGNVYKITKDSIRVDLADERPTWIMSCYGPGKDAPEQLFGGYPREQSLEEAMVYIRGAANQQQAMAEVTSLYQQAEQQIISSIGNLDGAVQFLLAAENNHPNRNDICRQNTREGGTNGTFARDNVPSSFGSNPLSSNTNQNPFSTTQPNPFAGGSTAFGQPAALGQKPSPFGAPAQTSAFGQPSQMGAAAPAFGQPSQMGASASAFGQTSQLGATTSAFGQPSAIGQKPNPFGAGTTPSTSSGFGQPTQSAFGQPSTLGAKPSPFSTTAASMSSPFAQPAAATAPSPFSQPAASTPSSFGQPAASNPFAAAPAVSQDQSMDTTASAPASAASNPFAQAQGSGFGSQPQTNNAFAVQPSGPVSNPFGQPPAQQQIQAQTGAAKGGPYRPDSTKQHPPASAYINKSMNGQLVSFNGQQVAYRWKVGDKYQDTPPPDTREPSAQVPGVRNRDGTWRKIFFPDGPPNYNKDTEPDANLYDTGIQAKYAKMQAMGRFDGDMPEVPPMREDCVWNF
ncbi:hypothetical protein F5Y15DRAFT_109848 [Xylariaceae sp. FL0016]|nr:hypothetical protein F5Y15DRAFT_109848 [Xylariaceae sp. FL0016]